MASETYYERWTREALEEGRLEGRLEGEAQERTRAQARERQLRVDHVRQVLQARFGHVPERLLAKLQAASDAQLDRWLVLAATATSVEAVFEAEAPASTAS